MMYRGYTMTGEQWRALQREATARVAALKVACTCGWPAQHPGAEHSETCAVEVAWEDAVEALLDEGWAPDGGA